jgi:methylated-DNA-[protein]-cysteine S-methyltransferase
MRAHTVLDSPVGPLVGVVQDGVLVRLGPDPAPDPDVVGPRDDDALPALREQLDGYWAGTLRDFDLPLGPPGRPWQQEVWARCAPSPSARPGPTASSPRTSAGRRRRARSGAANGRNPVFLVVPVPPRRRQHRRAHGYAGGLDMKRRLLDHERAAAWAPPAR